jgi:AraC family transcriptional regulator, regulatory protein of adaptative response / DNA-3-methyladenine glycosylase II
MTATPPTLSPAVCSRALDARDPRFDGLFFVGITTTRIYCRPVCPARVSYHERRRFFDTAASAERAGFRPCLRCRPELAPGRAVIDAVPNLARVAAHRIAAGALNGRGVAQLAHELGVSDRHLRRVLERELGVSPLELAQTHRLLLAKRLLADTALPVTRIAYASGFQSLRRFNSVFRERYRLRPSALRRQPAAGTPAPDDLVRLTLAYRAPFAWDVLIGLLARGTMPDVEAVEGGRYARTVRLEGRSGTVLVERPADDSRTHLIAHVSSSLLPVLMPLLARLRQLLDLDAEPAAVDAHLARGGLGSHVARRPGLRMPGAFDGFEAALRVLLGSQPDAVSERARRVVRAYGEPLHSGVAGLTRLAPEPGRVARASVGELAGLGVPARRAETIVAVARALAAGRLWLHPGSDARAAQRVLRSLDGIDDRLATAIVSQALHWPDAFPASDRALQRAAHASSARELLARAEAWRPWRGYAALHVRLEGLER